MTALPTGRPGQALAMALLLLALALVWLGAVSPVLGWYAGRAERLTQQRTLAARMQSVADSAPDLQQRLATADAGPPAARALFDGSSDAVAGATLQQAVQDISTHAGADILSAEVLPAAPVGSYRRIGIHVTVAASWPVLVAVLSATLQATPRMLVNDLQLRRTEALGARDTHPMEAGFTVVAFSAPGQVAR